MSCIATTHWTRTHGTLLLAVSLEPHEIGRRIAAARQNKGWTQLTFAIEANISPSTVARWEAGKLPPVRELMRIADVLGVEPEAFVEPPTSASADVDSLRQAVREELGEVIDLMRSIEARLERVERRAG